MLVSIFAIIIVVMAFLLLLVSARSAETKRGELAGAFGVLLSATVLVVTTVLFCTTPLGRKAVEWVAQKTSALDAGVATPPTIDGGWVTLSPAGDKATFKTPPTGWEWVSLVNGTDAKLVSPLVDWTLPAKGRVEVYLTDSKTFSNVLEIRNK